MLIVAAVLVALNAFWLRPRLSNAHVDLLAFWLPRWCHLGEALSSGRIPTWLPNQFGGVPSASDPQSGWLYAPPMILFTLFSCARAIGLMVVLQPIVAGLGLYAFFRNEGLGRTAATVGGLTLALAMAGSAVALSMPFSGTLAWTAVALAGAAGFLRAMTLARRLGWAALAAFAWAQIAGALLTHGLLLGTFLVGLYVLARSVADVRAGRQSVRHALLSSAALLLSLPLLSVAALVPRLALLPRTSIGHGYVGLSLLASELSGSATEGPFEGGGVGPWWMTSFARGPGGYVGAIAILLIPCALSSARWRLPASAFALAGLFGYVVNLEPLIESSAVRSLALDTWFGQMWLRAPARFRYLLLPAFAAMAAYGLQAWLDAAPVRRTQLLRRASWALPVVVLFGLLPLAAGSPPALSIPFALGVAVGLPLLLLAAAGRAWAAPAVAGLVAAELTVSALAAQAAPIVPRRRAQQAIGSGLERSFVSFPRPAIPPSAYLTAGPIGRALVAARAEHGRYLAFLPRLATRNVRGFLWRQDPDDWPVYENGRSILFGLEEIQGYSPVQLDRYWRLVRRVARAPVFFNSAVFQDARPSVLRLFGVRWMIVAGDEPGPFPLGAEPVAREGRFVLHRLADAQPRASVVFDTRLADADRALETIVDPAFDPARTALVETEAALVPPSAGGTGAAQYSERSPEDVRVQVTSNAPALLVVRNVFDDAWRAEVDGQPSAVHRVDYVIQGVVVPPGDHQVRLFYDDVWIGRGLAAGALVGGALVLAVILARKRAPGRRPRLG